MKRSIATLLCLALAGQFVPTCSALDSSAPEADRPFMFGGVQSQASQVSKERPDLLQQSLVDLFTGSAQLNYPLHVPPSFPDATPKLSLDYSSQRDARRTEYGFAWQTRLGKIERRLLPGPFTLYSRDAFRIDMLGLQGDLVLIDTQGTLETYGPEHETLFPLIVRDTATNSWTVTTTNGTVHSFGLLAETREQNSDSSKTYNWHLENVIDTKGNRIDYQYARIENSLYPQAIRYGSQSLENHPFAIIFEPFDQVDPLPNRPKRQIDMLAGFKRTYQHQVDAIRIEVHGTERLRYALTYSDPTRTEQSHLQSIAKVAPATPAQVTRFTYYKPSEKPAAAQRLVKSIKYPAGGTFELEYTNAKSLRKADQAVNKRPHVRTTVVSKVTASDGLGRTDATDYFYETGGYYFNHALQRQTAGFGQVTVTDPMGNETVHAFHQGRGLPSERFFSVDTRPLIGKEYRTVRHDIETGFTQTTFQEWKTVPISPDRHFVYPELIVKVFDDGLTSRAVATSHIYDTTNGNLLETIDYGQVELTETGFNDVMADSRHQLTEYAHNTSRHYYNRPSSEVVYNHENNLVTRTVYQYDNLPTGEIEAGSTTHERRWLEEEARELVTLYTHTPKGQVATSLSPRLGLTQFQYEVLGLYPNTIINPLEQATTYAFDLLTGESIRVTGPNGMTAKRTLDGFGRWILQEETHAEGALQPHIRRWFDETVQPNAQRTILLLDGTDQAETINYIDGFGRTIQQRIKSAPKGNGYRPAPRPSFEGEANEPQDGTTDTVLYSVLETAYDALGRKASVSVSQLATGANYVPLPASTPKTETTYDAFDRVVQTRDANGITTSDYQDAGALKVVTDANNHQTDYSYDAFDRLERVSEHHGSEAYQTDYKHDVRGLITRIQDAQGNERSFVYDSLGRLTLLEDLHQPANVLPPVWKTKYDDANNVIQTVDPRGQVIISEYDLLDRVKLRSLTDAQQAQTEAAYSYDQGTHAIGRLTAIETPDYTWAADHDIRGRITRETLDLDGAEFTKTTTYTSFDKPERVTYPNRESVDYTYNSVGQLDQMAAGSKTIVGPIVYTADSRLEEIEYGNQFVSTFTYDLSQMLRLSAKQTQDEENVVQDLSYKYDSVGNIVQLDDQAPTAIHGSLAYTYDALNRLETATPLEGEATVYTYTPIGNVSSKGGADYHYATQVTDHPQAVQTVSEGVSLDYDPAGNVSQFTQPDGQYQLDWNAQNELKQVEHTENLKRHRVHFTYDTAGRRLRKVLKVFQDVPCELGSSNYANLPVICRSVLQSTQTTRYPFSDYQVDPSGATRITISAGEEHVATLVQRDSTKCASDHASDHALCLPVRSIYYHHDDHLGGSSLVTNEAGTITQLLDYEPFGAVKTDTQYGDYDSTEKFTGYELDDSTGLYYAGARYYHPALARFTAIDPLQRRPAELFERFGHNPQGLNAYTYANNNPLILVDPTGEYVLPALAVPYLAAGVVALAGAFHFRDSLDAVGQAISSIAAGSASRVRRLFQPPEKKPDRALPPASVGNEKNDHHIHKLKGRIDRLTKGKNNPERIGDGSTPDAIRYERETGRPVQDHFHGQKGADELRGMRHNLRNIDSRLSNRSRQQQSFKMMRNLHDSLRNYRPPNH